MLTDLPNGAMLLADKGYERQRATSQHYRRIATRYDKLAENFLAALKLVAVGICAVMSLRPKALRKPGRFV
jgi:hypothetical protein